MLNISGEAPIDSANNKWSRFNQSFSVPPNCEVEKLQAKFTQGILAITMPKKPILPPQQQPPKKAQDNNTKEEPRPDKKAQEEKTPQKYGSTRVEEAKPRGVEKVKSEKEPISQKYVEEPRPERKAQEDKAPQKYTPASGARVEEVKPEKAREKITQKYGSSRVEEAKPGKAQEKIPQEEASSSTQRLVESQKKLEEEKGLKALVPPGPIRKPKDEVVPQEGPSEIVEEEEPMLKIIPRKPKPEEKGQEEIKQEDTQMPTILRRKQTNNNHVDEKEKEKIFGQARKPEKMGMEKEDNHIIETIGKGMRQVSECASQVITRISERKWNEQEKPMIVNMGAALLVIAALGAYVSYKLASSGSSQS